MTNDAVDFLKHVRRIHFSLIVAAISLSVAWSHLSTTEFNYSLRELAKILNSEQILSHESIDAHLSSIENEICRFKSEYDITNYKRFIHLIKYSWFDESRTRDQYPKADLWSSLINSREFSWIRGRRAERHMPECLARLRPETTAQISHFNCCAFKLEFTDINEVVLVFVPMRYGLSQDDNNISDRVAGDRQNIRSFTLPQLRSLIASLSRRSTFDVPVNISFEIPNIDAHSSVADRKELAEFAKSDVVAEYDYEIGGFIFSDNALLSRLTSVDIDPSTPFGDRENPGLLRASVETYEVRFPFSPFSSIDAIEDLDSTVFDPIEAWAQNNGLDGIAVGNIYERGMNETQERDRDIQIAGIAFPAALISSWGLIVLLSIQIYFYLNLRNLLAMLSDDLPHFFPWIMVYEDPFSRVVGFVITIAFPPCLAFAMIIWLRDSSTINSLGLALCATFVGLFSIWVSYKTFGATFELVELFKANRRKSSEP